MRGMVYAIALLGTAGIASGIGVGVPAAAQGQNQRDFNVGVFDAVALAGSYNVVVVPGRTHAVRATGNAEALDRLEIKVEGGTLRIGSKRNGWFQWRSSPGGAVTVHVMAPAINAASIAGSGDLRVEQVEGRAFNASIAGSGDLHIGRMRVEEARVSIAGSGSVHAAGAAASTHVRIAGSGDADLRGLDSRNAKVSVMGSGDVRMRATETADVSVMGSGDVDVAGGARCTVNRRGSGRVNCGA